MAITQVINSTQLHHPPVQARICKSFIHRLRGLMFVKSLEEYQGILIDERGDSKINSAIHMFFMNFDLAVIWIDSSKIVVDKVFAQKWRPLYQPKQAARYILECHPNRLDDFAIGDSLHF